MKRTILNIFILSVVSTGVFAQGDLDALRYSQLNYGGSARFQSMGGAFGALGSDFSSLSYNPAGIGMYRSSEFVISPTYNYAKASSSYYGTTAEDFKGNLNLGQLGLVMNYNTGNNDGLVSGSWAFGYNRFNNFNSNYLITGTNPTSSMADYFAARAEGNKYSELNPYDTQLAWNAFVIDPANNDTTSYYSNGANNNRQNMSITKSGSIGEWVFSMGGNFFNKLYLGATLGIDKVDYEMNSTYTESYTTNPNQLTDFTYNNYLKTRGTGYSFKIGGIFKPVDALRLGLAVHFPTTYKLSDEYDASMSSLRGGSQSTAYPLDNNNNPLPMGTYDYKVVTPFRTIASVAVQIQKIALLSFDYEYVDYTTMRLREGGDGYNFTTENQSITNNYKPSGNLRAGAEVRLGDFAVRGGVAYLGSPYKSDNPNKDMSTLAISSGFGFRQQNFFIDFAYTYSMTKNKEYMYNSVNSEYVAADPAAVYNPKLYASRATLTVGFRF
jgi:hypothetical protein